MKCCSMWKPEKKEQAPQRMVVMRHGQRLDEVVPQWREGPEDNYWDPSITLMGFRQAAAAARELAGYDLRRLVMSPFTRCLQTGAAIVAGHAPLQRPQATYEVDRAFAEILDDMRLLQLAAAAEGLKAIDASFNPQAGLINAWLDDLEGRQAAWKLALRQAASVAIESSGGSSSSGGGGAEADGLTSEGSTHERKPLRPLPSHRELLHRGRPPGSLTFNTELKPTYPEPVQEAYARIFKRVDSLGERGPNTPDLLVITHGEAVVRAFNWASPLKRVYAVEHCGFVVLQRLWDAPEGEWGTWEVERTHGIALTKSP